MQAGFKTYRIDVRIKQTFNSGVKLAQLGYRFLSCFMNRRLFVYQFSSAKNWYEKILAAGFLGDFSSKRDVS